MLIAGDIGGTKTRLALYSVEAGPRRPTLEREFHSADYQGLEAIVERFLADSGARAVAACFDVAGPVIDGRARLTNLPWVVEEQALRQRLGLKSVVLLNDLRAIAYAVPHLQPDELRTVKPGRAQPHGAMAVVAPGTGLGEAFVVWSGSEYIACASEGGHSDFAPTDDLQAELLAFMRRCHGHVSYESVCSGHALPDVYAFLRDSGLGIETPAFAARLARAEDRTPVIVEAARGGPGGNALCELALQTFVSILGAEAGNLALKVLATGGVYLGGGIPRRIVEQLQTPRFAGAFVAKGRFEETMKAIPVHVIVMRAAILGAAIFGLAQMQAQAV